MKNIFLLIAFIFCASFSNAQVYVKIKQGQAADTLKASQTVSHVVNVLTPQLQTMSMHVFIDSVSGTPSGTATLYRSLDGIRWETTGKTATWTTGVDTSFILTDTSFYGVYAKAGIVCTAASQKSKYSITVKSWNK